MERVEDARKIGRIVVEAGAEHVQVVTKATPVGDPRRLRGLPAIGRNVSGATWETDPVRALLAKEHGRRR
jgi:hypothetical protein